ncbi:MAG: phage portal protein [Planctomycetota bacterium]
MATLVNGALCMMSASSLPKPAALAPDLLEWILAEHVGVRRPNLERLWRYYRNAADPDSPAYSSAGRSAQARGLPARLTRGDANSTREVVIENDIAWRIHALVDFMFGQPLLIQSRAASAGLAEKINHYLSSVFRSNGGESFFHDMALLGSVYGYADILVRPPVAGQAEARLELIEAPRAVPVVSPGDYRRLDAYLIHHSQLTHELRPVPFLGRVLGRQRSAERKTVDRTEAWTAEGFEVFRGSGDTQGRGRVRVDGGANRLGRVPVVHIQNLAQPFYYEGLSDVEALVPLQDELNTRLSDRANRVTFQSFKMYLGKGIDGFTERPVGPGQMWATDNPDASIHEFGGDASTPSEDQHIREVREAMDKASGVSPIAAGVVGGRTGNLSSENAIRIVLLGLLARIEKKRLTYGAGIEQLCEMILHAADVTGVLPNRAEDRRVRLDWPTPFPDSEERQLKNALAKKELGVPADQLLAELGYADCAHREQALV